MCKGPLATASHRQIFHLETVYAITSLGEERANLSAVRMFDRLCLFGFVGFLFLLMSGKACGL